MRFKKNRGFTLLELLIVIGLISLIAIIIYLTLNPKKQIETAWDVKRKNNLSMIRNLFEEYYNDKTYYPMNGEVCYTQIEIVNGNCYCKICSSKNEEENILPGNLCDPQSSAKDYLYQFDCGIHPLWYRVCAQLSHPDDSNISSPSGLAYNYGVSSSNTTPENCQAIGFGPTSGVIPTSVPSTVPTVILTVATPTLEPEATDIPTKAPTKIPTKIPTSTPIPLVPCSNAGVKYCLDNGYCNNCGSYINCMNNCTQKSPLYNDYLCSKPCYY